MQAYYTVNDPDDPVAVHATVLRREHYLLWSQILPADEDDAAVMAERLASSTGESPYLTLGNLLAVRRLQQLPMVRELQDRLFHLDFPRLRAIDTALNKADMSDDDTVAFMDVEISAYLTPRRARQVLPTRGKIARFIDQLITRIDSSVASDDDLPEEPVDDYKFFTDSSRSSTCQARLDTATAAVVDAHIRATAKEHGVSMARAFVMLCTGEVKPAARVVVNAYSGPQASGMVFIPGKGWTNLDDVTGGAEPAKTRDMDDASTRTTDSYVTPTDIGTFVEGRDGTCRWPGCGKQAAMCQKDHRINHADGGPTTAMNLFSLCQHHHNVKTDKRAFYINDPLTGDIVWLFPGGGWEYDRADGPLASDNARWLQTLGQTAEARAAHARQRAQDAKAARTAAESALSSFADA